MDISNISAELSTPIKRIKNLHITSPTFQFAPKNLYPTLNDLDTEMANKGYSRRLTNNVLDELDARASEISRYMSPLNNSTNIMSPGHSSGASASCSGSGSGAGAAAARRKRYSGVHRDRFNKMDSISSHYAASRDHHVRRPTTTTTPGSCTPSGVQVEAQTPHPMIRNEVHHQNIPTKMDIDDKREPEEIVSSVTKRRRTLHGPEEVIPVSVLQSSPTTSAVPHPILHPPSPCPQTKASVSPVHSINSSPIRKISPSKGSMNLNQLLNNTASSASASTYSSAAPTYSSASMSASASASASTRREFLKPRPVLKPHAQPQSPGRVRISSLEMAGVKSTSNASINSFIKAPSPPSSSTTPQLHKKPSYTSLGSHPSLHRKTSIPVMNNSATSSTSTSSHMPAPSIPTLKKKTSIPTLQKKPSIPTLSRKSSHSTLADTHFSHQFTPHVTTPKPFSLYNKPTISSSQKSIDKQTTAHPAAPARSLKHKSSNSSLPPTKRTESRFSRLMKLGSSRDKPSSAW
ncbi:hypothetical protein CAAN1_26S00342 [[Candida] anglica]|uniref:Uncharacterized protein n=1 Tax=[Candida] anglica TaxID=148631 RepID=A0ABP0EHH0_9ASCO